MKKFTHLLFIAGSLIATLNLQAQIYWNFNTASPTSNSFSNVSVGPITQGNNVGSTTLLTSTSPSTGYTGASGGNNAALTAQAVGFDPTQTGYFQTVLTPSGTNSVVLTGISFGSWSSATGPQGISIRSSVDNYTTDLLTFTLLPNSTWALFSNTLSLTGIAGSTVTLRIFGYNGAGTPTAGTANWKIDDLSLNPSSPLPLNLTAFNASFNGRSAQLKWTTASEMNVNGYAVEKSVNSTDFKEIAFVKAKNTASSAYLAEDNNVTAPVNYYRIKMVDADGSARYSRIVTIYSKSQFGVIEVFPNPVVNSVVVLHPKAAYGTAVSIMTADGKQVNKYIVEEGATQTTLQVSNLAKGSYMLLLQDKNNKLVTRFVKQ